MGLGKSLGIGFIIYIVLNFLMNMLLAIALTIDLSLWFGAITVTPFAFISKLFVVGPYMPNGFSILTGIGTGITMLSTSIFYAIMSFVAYIIPALISAIIAGKMADNSKQGFLSWLLISLLCSIILLVFQIVAPGEMGAVIIFGIAELWSVIVYTLLIGVFNGLLWSGIAAITAAED